MHRLQELFATAEGERMFEDHLHALFAASDFAQAEQVLREALDGLDAPVAGICRSMGRDAVVVSGLEDFADAIEGMEGDPVSAVVITAANSPDLAFEKGVIHEPVLSAGLFTDESFAFSGSAADAIIAEHGNPEGRAWDGAEEDCELYLEIEGLGALNTALLFHKQRHFFRDENPAQAPLRYVDYVVGCWWRALVCQQAIAAAFERHVAASGIRAVVALSDMRPELLSVLGNGDAAALAASQSGAATASIAPESLIKREVVEEEKEVTGRDLRRLVAESAPAEPEIKPGFFQRLFGLRREYDRAA